jgi:ribosome-associated heat shock protein Hsp15
VRRGSVIALPLHDQVRILKVLDLPHRRGPAQEARLCYEELGIDGAQPPT